MRGFTSAAKVPKEPRLNVVGYDMLISDFACGNTGNVVNVRYVRGEWLECEHKSSLLLLPEEIVTRMMLVYMTGVDEELEGVGNTLGGERIFVYVEAGKK